MAKSRPRGAKAKGSAIEQALLDLTAFIDGFGAPASIIGGIAVIAWGFGRSTLDIDAAISVPPSEAAALLARLKAAGFAPRIPHAAKFAEENLVLLLRHVRTQVDVDVSLAQLDFEREALAHTQRRPFGIVTIPVPRPTDLIVYKMIAARPRDLQDVEELLSRGLGIDERRVESLLRDFDALLGLDRAEQWRRLFERVRAE